MCLLGEGHWAEGWDRSQGFWLSPSRWATEAYRGSLQARNFFPETPKALLLATLGRKLQGSQETVDNLGEEESFQKTLYVVHDPLHQHHT